MVHSGYPTLDVFPPCQALQERRASLVSNLPPWSTVAHPDLKRLDDTGNAVLSSLTMANVVPCTIGALLKQGRHSERSTN